MLNIIIINDYGCIRTTRIHFEKMYQILISEYHFEPIPYADIATLSQPDMVKLFLSKFGSIPDNILFDEHLTDIFNINIPPSCKINILIDDLHHQGAIKRNRNKGLTKVDRILSTYAYTFSKYYSICPKNSIYYFPHCASFALNFNVEPIKRILVSGRLHKTIYPFREILVNISKTNPNVDYMPVNCNYSIQQDHERLIYGERYVKKLSNYLACFTCDASIDRPYVVAKHFEIMASGSLLLAGNPNTKYYFEKLGFIDGIHYISATESNINEKINYILDPANRENIDKIRKSGYLFTTSNHMYKNRASYLVDIITCNTDSMIKYTDGISNSVYYTPKYS